MAAVVGGEAVGIARYDRSPTDPSTAEFAILVEDGRQGSGWGRRLLTELAELAAARGVTTLTATVQRDNDRVVGLIRRLLPHSTFTAVSDVLDVRSPLDPSHHRKEPS